MGELIFCRLLKESADETGEEGVLLNSESGTEILIYSKLVMRDRKIYVKGLKHKRLLHVDYSTNDLYFSITIYIKAN